MPADTTEQIPAFLIPALVNGDLSGLETPEDQMALDFWQNFLGEGEITECSEPYFSWQCRVGLDKYIGGNVVDCDIFYPA